MPKQAVLQEARAKKRMKCNSQGIENRKGESKRVDESEKEKQERDKLKFTNCSLEPTK